LLGAIKPISKGKGQLAKTQPKGKKDHEKWTEEMITGLWDPY